MSQVEGGGSSFENTPPTGNRRYKVRSKRVPTENSKRKRRNWTEVEESVLLSKLKELVLDGWKTENGFRPGYQNRLEEMMLLELPGTDIRANPHINSKIIVWKRLYGSLRVMLKDNSGIGFNSTTHLIDCDNDMWERIVKKDPGAATMRFKPWPMYDDWLEVFGNDRATGSGAEDVYEAFTALVDDDVTVDGVEYVDVESEQPQGGTPGHGANAETQQQPEVNVNCSMDKDSETQAPPARGDRRPNVSRKRCSSAVNSEDQLMNVLCQMATSSDNRLVVICDAFNYESNLGLKRSDIYNLLGDIPGLTLDQRIDTSNVLVQNTAVLEMFLGFPPEARARYVHRIISGDVDV